MKMKLLLSKFTSPLMSLAKTAVRTVYSNRNGLGVKKLIENLFKT